MTLDEQVLACAIDNGYDGEYAKPNRVSNGYLYEWRIYYHTSNGIVSAWTITDEQLKQWQRDYKLKNLIG
jgi:hypothetical protein